MGGNANMKRRYADGGIYTAEMGQPPMDPEMAPPDTPPPRKPKPKPKPVKKPPITKNFASGGYTKAADGCAQRGKTKGKMVKMKSGGRYC